jgi:hypothetical protein
VEISVQFGVWLVLITAQTFTVPTDTVAETPVTSTSVMVYAIRKMAVVAEGAGNWIVKLPAVTVLSDPNASTATALLP